MSEPVDTVEFREQGPASSGAVALYDGVLDRELKPWHWASYGLHFLVAVSAAVPGLQVGIGFLLVAILLDLIKRDGIPADNWNATHFSWRLRSVLWAAVWYVVTIPLWLLLIVPGLVAWWIISLWFLYRIFKGINAFSQKRAVTS